MFSSLWRELRKSMQRKAVILMYHQVSEKKADPWQLAVTPENFQMQLDILAAHFNVLPLHQLVDDVRRGKLQKNSVAITFDDGFEDNYTSAAPILDWFKLPATFYITSSAIRTQRLFWWDELQTLILWPDYLPKNLNITIGGEPFIFTFNVHQRLTASAREEMRSWIYGADVKNERVTLYLRLWERIKPLQHLDQYTVMRVLRKWSAQDYIPLGENGPMLPNQVKKLSMNKLFTIGGHTVNHVMLGSQSEIVQSYEIRECRADILELTDIEVRGFAYPYGNFNETSKRLLQKFGFDHGVSTEEGAVTSESDVFQLPRLQVKNWGTQEFGWKLRQFVK